MLPDDIDNPQPDSQPDPQPAPQPDPQPDPQPQVPPVPPQPAPQPPVPPVPPQPAPMQMTEDQWQILEKRFGMPRQQILAQYSIAQVVQETSIKTEQKTREVFATVESELLANPATKDFAAYKDEINARLSGLSQQERLNPDIVRGVYFRVKGERLSAGTPAPAGSQPGSRRVSSGSISSGSEPMPTPDGNAQLGKLDEFGQQVCQNYGINSDKDLKANQGREVPMEDEYHFTPKFGRK